MEVDAGTVVLALVLDTLSGRSPLYRLEEFFAQHDTALLLGKAVPLHSRNYPMILSLQRMVVCPTPNGVIAREYSRVARAAT
jgi:hypothetical protein